MTNPDIKNKIKDLIKIDKIIKSNESKKEKLRKEILDFMSAKNSNLVTVPNVCKIFLQSKETFKNYPEDVVELQNILNIKMKEAELSGNIEKKVTYFIKLELIKPKKENHVSE